MKHNQETYDIKFYGVDLTVNGYYYAGYAGDWQQPPEPREFEIFSVYCNDIDITEMLENSFSFNSKVSMINEIEQEILENYYT